MIIYFKNITIIIWFKLPNENWFKVLVKAQKTKQNKRQKPVIYNVKSFTL